MEPEENKALLWILSYVGSPGWMYRRNQYQNQDPEYIKDYLKSLKVQYNPTMPDGNAVYNWDSSIDYGRGGEYLIPHEYGHAVDNVMYNSGEEVDTEGWDEDELSVLDDIKKFYDYGSNHMDILEPKKQHNSEEDAYGDLRGEKYANHMLFRSLLNDLNIYDSNKPEPFTEEHYNKYIEKVNPGRRNPLIQLLPKHTVIKIMNGMASTKLSKSGRQA